MPVFTPIIGAATAIGTGLGATGAAATIAGGASMLGTASGLAQTGMGIAGAAGGGGGGSPQGGGIPAPQGNPMAQNAFASNGQQQQQLDMDPIGGLPGGGGWAPMGPWPSGRA